MAMVSIAIGSRWRYGNNSTVFVVIKDDGGIITIDYEYGHGFRNFIYKDDFIKSYNPVIVDEV